MHRQTNTKPFGIILLFLALTSTLYALYVMPPTGHTNSVFFESLSAEQEAIVMTAFLLFVLGLFCMIAPKRKL